MIEKALTCKHFFFIVQKAALGWQRRPEAKTFGNVICAGKYNQNTPSGVLVGQKAKRQVASDV